MARPATPELDVVEAQAARLRLITGGTDWHTALGEDLRYELSDAQDPGLYVGLAAVECAPTERLGALVAVTWRATVPLVPDEDGRVALRVLADMRAALLCGADATRVQDVRVEMRAAGSNYASVSVTAAVHRPIN